MDKDALYLPTDQLTIMANILDFVNNDLATVILNSVKFTQL